MRLFYCRIGGILSGKNLSWWNVVFTGGFQEKGVLDVVFLWSGCGVMCGKDGHWTRSFRKSKIMQIFQLYFWREGALAAGNLE